MFNFLNANKANTKFMVSSSLMAAVLCIFSPITIVIPFSPVPLSLATFFVYLLSAVLSMGTAVSGVSIYILIGMIGLPVFSGFTGGFQKVLGPTGGYLLGYILCALIVGYLTDKFENKYYMYVVGMIIGTLACYFVGTIWLAFVTNTNFIKALYAGVIPFVFLDILKIVLASVVGFKMRKRLGRLC